MAIAKLEPTYFIPLSEREIALLCLRSPAKKIFVQGGKIQIAKSATPGIYSVSSLVVKSSEWIWITATSKDREDGIEIFRLAFETGEVVSAMISSKMNHPQFAELLHYPPDIDFSVFSDGAQRIYLLRKVVTRSDASNHRVGTTETENGVLITNNAKRLLVYLDEEIPLNICITTRPSAIDSYLKSLSGKIEL